MTRSVTLATTETRRRQARAGASTILAAMLKRAVNDALARRGYQITRRPGQGELRDTHPDLDPDFEELHRRCAPYTMTSVERMYALYQAVRYIVDAGIE